MKPKTPKKRNPQDKTSRNIDPLKRRIKSLEIQAKADRIRIRILEEDVDLLLKQFKQKESGKSDTMNWLKSVEQRLKALEAVYFIVATPEQKGRRS